MDRNEIIRRYILLMGNIGGVAKKSQNTDCSLCGAKRAVTQGVCLACKHDFGNPFRSGNPEELGKFLKLVEKHRNEFQKSQTPKTITTAVIPKQEYRVTDDRSFTVNRSVTVKDEITDTTIEGFLDD